MLSGLLGCWCCWLRACVGVCAWLVSRFVVGGVLVGVSGESGCLGAGCVVRGGVLPVWLGGAVAGGGVGVGFDVGGRAFTFGGVSVPVSGSGFVVPVLPGVGVAASEFVSESAPVGSVSSLVPLSGSVPVSGSASVSSSGSVVAECGGVRVCVPCAVRVFGDGWCFLVLRRWVRAAGVDGVRVSGLFSSSVDCVPGFGSVLVASSPVSGGCVSASGSSRVGRVGVGFGARVRDWGARVGVGGGVVSGGGVVVSWWARARGWVSGLVSDVGVWGLVGLCGVGVVVLVSVLVCFL